MSSSLSSLADNLSEGIHNNKCEIVSLLLNTYQPNINY